MDPGALLRAHLSVEAYFGSLGAAVAAAFPEGDPRRIAGLRLIRDRAPARMDVAAGEYGFDPWYFRAMLEAGAVDVLQADATRCLGYTGFLRAAALADAFQLPLSSHCAPALHLPVMLAAPRAVHMEWFHDHVRIERMFFDGAPGVANGAVRADLDRPGNGLELRRADAERYAI